MLKGALAVILALFDFAKGWIRVQQTRRNG